MKKTSLVSLILFSLTCIIYPVIVQGQPGFSRGGYYGMGPGMMGGWIDIPAKLPVPKSKEWINRLSDILASEKESLAQYETDQEKYNVYMPYMMVIPQEENHIYWIEQMFAAYSIKTDVKTPQIIKSKSLEDAYEIGVKVEADLLPRYEWLVKNAEDRDSAEILNTILLQSRWHWVMFQHALGVGTGYRFHGPGMMYWGYGYTFGLPHVILVLFFVAVIAGALMLIMYLRKSARASGANPLKILKSRYAKGEITKEEYKKIKSDLK